MKDNHGAQFGVGNVEYILSDVGISIFFFFFFFFFFLLFFFGGRGGRGDEHLLLVSYVQSHFKNPLTPTVTPHLPYLTFSNSIASGWN